MRLASLLFLALLAVGALFLLGVFDSTIAPEPPLFSTDDGDPGAGPELAAGGLPAVHTLDGDVLDGPTLLQRLQALDPEAAGHLLLSLCLGPDAKIIAASPALLAHLLEALASLLEALASSHGIASGGALRALAQMRPLPYTAVQPLLTHAEVAMRMNALRIMAAWASAGETFEDPGWIAAFRDPDARVRSCAWSVALGGVPYSETLAAFCEQGVPTYQGYVHRGPGVILAAMGPRGLSRLFDLLEQPESPVVFAALSALRMLKPGRLREFFPRLEPWLRTAHEQHQVLALQALLNQASNAAELMPALLAAWTHESFPVRLELMGLFERMGPKARGAAEVLLAAIDDDFDERITSRAMRQLGAMRALPTRVLPRLRSALDEGGDDDAARAIGAFGPAAAPYLRSALESPDADVRYFALAGVYRMGRAGAALRDLVLPLIGIDDAGVAERAAAAAGQMGEAASEAVPALWERGRDGFLKPAALGAVFHGIGAAAATYVLARLQGRAAESRLALAVLAGYPDSTEFALDSLGPFLTAREAGTRRLATQAAAAALRMPGTNYAARKSYIAPAPLRARLRALLAPQKEDPDDKTRRIASRVLGQIQAMASREATRTGR